MRLPSDLNRRITAVAASVVAPCALLVLAALAALSAAGVPFPDASRASLLTGDAAFPVVAALALMVWLRHRFGAMPLWETCVYGAGTGAAFVVKVALPGPVAHHLADAVVLALGIGAPLGLACALVGTWVVRLSLGSGHARTRPLPRPRRPPA